MTPITAHMLQIAKLALPVSLSRAGMLALILADTVMVGRVSTGELAHYALASAVFMILMMIGNGMLIGTAVLTSQALGAKEMAQAGVVWRVGLAMAAALGAVFWLLTLAGTAFFLAIGEPADLARGAGEVLLYAGPGVPGALLFVACSLFLESLRRPLPGFIAMVAANLLNLAANGWLLSRGAGAEGAMLATSLSRWLAALALLAYVLKLSDRAALNLSGPMSGWRTVSAKMTRLGLALGIAQGLESIAFACLTFFAGYLGALATAAFTIVMNTIATTFMGAVGITTATVVQVARAVGAGGGAAVVRAGWAGVCVVVLYMGAMALMVQAWAAPIGGLFTLDPALLAVVVPALAFAGIIFIPDGMQAVLMGALRGTGEAWVPTWLHLISFAGVMIPASWYLALRTDLGVLGLVLGTALGVAVAASVLGWRFYAVGRRPIGRV